MKTTYMIEIMKNGSVVATTDEHDDIKTLQNWIHGNYPGSIKIPVSPYEYDKFWVVDKYQSKDSTMLIRKRMILE